MAKNSPLCPQFPKSKAQNNVEKPKYYPKQTLKMSIPNLPSPKIPRFSTLEKTTKTKNNDEKRRRNALLNNSQSTL
jgi:hypothetical protein